MIGKEKYNMMFNDQPTAAQLVNIEVRRRPPVLVYSELGYKLVIDGDPLEVVYQWWRHADGADEPRGIVELGEIS